MWQGPRSPAPRPASSSRPLNPCFPLPGPFVLLLVSPTSPPEGLGTNTGVQRCGLCFRFVAVVGRQGSLHPRCLSTQLFWGGTGMFPSRWEEEADVSGSVGLPRAQRGLR